MFLHRFNLRLLHKVSIVVGRLQAAVASVSLNSFYIGAAGDGPRVLTDPKTTIRIFANVLLALQAS